MEAARQTEGAWPGAGILLLCACLLVAGFGAAWWRGPAPAGTVQVRLVQPSAVEVPAES
ncbi:MAG: hypothetical protein WEC72_01295 [Chthoniobacterales bacterium]